MHYDIFISHKNTDIEGNNTEDSKIAGHLCNILSQQGYSVFFSSNSLETIGSSRYKQDIDKALDSAKILIVVLTKSVYAESKWVKYEWDSFYSDYLSGIKKDALLFTLTKDVSINELPRTLRNVQNFKYDSDIEKLLNYIKNSYVKGTTKSIDIKNIPEPSDTLKTDDFFSIGEIILDKYRIIRKLTSGFASNTYQIKDIDSDKYYILKCIDNSIFNENKDSFPEMDLLAEITKVTPNASLPQIIHTFVEKKYYCFIGDIISGESLFKIVNDFGIMEEFLVIDIAKQLFTALHCLHIFKTPIIHRDIKPDNILYDSDGIIHLIDFGTARKYINRKQQHDTCYLGTNGYAAPEQFGGLGGVDFRTDIYGAGATLWYLCNADTPSTVWKNDKISEGLQYVIKKCINTDPADRYQTTEDVLNDLSSVHLITKKLHRKRSFRTFFTPWK